MKAIIDASHGVHDDVRGHTGVVVTIGGSVVWSRSSRQKINTKSSTESELIAVSDKLSDILWCRMFMESLGEVTKAPLVLCQDNQSTITMIKNGTASTGKSKHIQLRHFWMLQYVLDGELDLVYVPTEEMLADMLTKPLHGVMFKKFVKMLGLGDIRVKR